MLRIFLPLALVAGLLALAVWLWNAPAAAPTQPMAGGEASSALNVGGVFHLVDQNGQPRTDKDFLGRYMLVYFGYSFCPDICPNDMLAMSQVLDMLGNNSKDVAAIFISVDPERDTPEHVKKILSNFHPEMLGLTGSQEQVEQAKKSYKVYSAKATPDGTVAEYLVDHSTFMYLLDREGKYLAHFNHGTAASVIAERINRALASEFRSRL